MKELNKLHLRHKEINPRTSNATDQDFKRKLNIRLLNKYANKLTENLPYYQQRLSLDSLNMIYELGRKLEIFEPLAFESFYEFVKINSLGIQKEKIDPSLSDIAKLPKEIVAIIGESCGLKLKNPSTNLCEKPLEKCYS